MQISPIDAADPNVVTFKIYFHVFTRLIAQVRIGELCGNNNDQHLYIHLPEDKAQREGWRSQISFEFGGAQQYRYNIMVTQVNREKKDKYFKCV